VRRSFSWIRRAYKSTSRANFERPRMREPGRYAMCA
jgi:hypothetical protein